MKLLQEFADQKNRECQQQELELRKIIQQNLDNPDDYIIGVGQVEKGKSGFFALLARLMTNTKIMEYTDFLLAIDNKSKNFFAFKLGEADIVKTDLSDASIKKGNKILASLLNMEDRYNREKFSVKSVRGNFNFLVGPYQTGGTDYPYDNQFLLQALKSSR